MTVAVLSPVLRAEEPSAKPTSVDRKAFEEAKRKLAQKQRARQAEAVAVERERLRKADAQLRSETQRAQAPLARDESAPPHRPPVTLAMRARRDGVFTTYYIRYARDPDYIYGE
jgi:hypothetical protein